VCQKCDDGCRFGPNWFNVTTEDHKDYLVERALEALDLLDRDPAVPKILEEEPIAISYGMEASLVLTSQGVVLRHRKPTGRFFRRWEHVEVPYRQESDVVRQLIIASQLKVDHIGYICRKIQPWNPRPIESSLELMYPDSV
jgi:hypothetical protein